MEIEDVQRGPAHERFMIGDDPYFEYKLSKYTGEFYHCIDNPKCISFYRHMDGIPDCPGEPPSDEAYVYHKRGHFPNYNGTYVSID